ncbi:MAG: response regulator transcription factor [Rudaea sp.]
MSELSPRQLEVLTMVLAHRTDEEIASKLGIAPGTVKSHIRLIRSALGVRTRDELARWPGRQKR